ncbi:Bug family tripartite tricarboxylate transporter substrate binding protein [Candidimonas nitroreducens]|uniref:LacI family transcriptional regulator n=1 Tax=Candidimonas nitroreducens TaxID=683354 RepID=A0A225MMZ4_9BURK|nr:tripartite tricarboxylate transporter substrate binding protein [Candidimonas nitroreducens]OWT61733.1 hypothetical protein CEY11_07770 [Candidimonas nitroreducens]
MTIRTIWRAALTAALGVCALSGVSHAWASGSDYPTKPLRLIVPFAAGGGSDILARVVAQKLGDSLGQPVVVENHPGAGGNLGTEIVAKSNPDGYTILLGTVGPISINVSLFSKLPYDPERDLDPITKAVVVTNLLVVNPKLPVHSVAELIALAKSKPGKLTFATGGAGTAGHLAGELFNTTAGVKMTAVPYRGSGPAIVDVVAGHVDMSFENMPASWAQVKAGKLRALAVTTAKRSKAAPQIPTVAESGLPGYQAENWYGFFAPAHTPRAVIDRLYNDITHILNEHDVQKKLATLGEEVVGNDPAQFAKEIHEEIPKWHKVVQESGAKIN